MGFSRDENWVRLGISTMFCLGFGLSLDNIWLGCIFGWVGDSVLLETLLGWIFGWFGDLIGLGWDGLEIWLHLTGLGCRFGLVWRFIRAEWAGL